MHSLYKIVGQFFFALIYVTVRMWFFETSAAEGGGQESTTGLKKAKRK